MSEVHGEIKPAINEIQCKSCEMKFSFPNYYIHSLLYLSCKSQGLNYDFQFCLNLVMLFSKKVVNFTFVPSAHRVLFVNLVSIFWNTFLAWSSHRNQDDDSQSPQVPILTPHPNAQLIPAQPIPSQQLQRIVCKASTKDP